MANMFDNPGFEPITESHLIIVGSGATSSSFTDTSDPSLGGGYAPTKYPTGFWNGGKASVRTGAAAGDQFTITSYTSNGSYTFGSCQDATGNPISCPTLAAGVGVAEVQTGPTLFGGMQGVVLPRGQLVHSAMPIATIRPARCTTAMARWSAASPMAEVTPSITAGIIRNRSAECAPATT